MKIDEAKKRAILRFIRTAIPQIPAGITSVLSYTQGWNLPAWVVPTLMLIGAIATGVDKFLRDMNM